MPYYYRANISDKSPGAILAATGIPEEKLAEVKVKIKEESRELQEKIDWHVDALKYLLLMFFALDAIIREWPFLLHHFFGLQDEMFLHLGLNLNHLNLTFMNEDGENVVWLPVECLCKFDKFAGKSVLFSLMQGCLHFLVVLINPGLMKFFGKLELFLLPLFVINSGAYIALSKNCNLVGFMFLAVWILINSAELMVVITYCGYINKLQKKKDKCVIIMEFEETELEVKKKTE